jgi:protocatechuate 3,4-dioxygenase beta subunit
MPSHDDRPVPGSLSRRSLLSLAGAAGAAALAAPRRAEAELVFPGLNCVVRPAQTEGPYFVDRRLNRADIRPDPSDRTVPAGDPFAVIMAVHRVSGSSCAPLANAHVDLWQCDALGVYSDVRDFQGRFDTRGKHFLRGYQLTGTDGLARFTTVYPGFYEGRAPHIHFKVRLFEGTRVTREFTSQFYFDEAVNDRVYARAPYNTNTGRRVRNNEDRIWLQGGTGSQLMLPVRGEPGRMEGRFDIGLAF